MQQMSLREAVLIQLFQTARADRRPNFPALCRRTGASAEELAAALRGLAERGLVLAERPSLTLPGLAVAAALSRSAREARRPIARCRQIAA